MEAVVAGFKAWAWPMDDVPAPVLSGVHPTRGYKFRWWRHLRDRALFG